jgi:hypothetical protein
MGAGVIAGAEAGAGYGAGIGAGKAALAGEAHASAARIHRRVILPGKMIVMSVYVESVFDH